MDSRSTNLDVSITVLDPSARKKEFLKSLPDHLCHALQNPKRVVIHESMIMNNTKSRVNLSINPMRPRLIPVEIVALMDGEFTTNSWSTLAASLLNKLWGDDEIDPHDGTIIGIYYSLVGLFVSNKALISTTILSNIKESGYKVTVRIISDHQELAHYWNTGIIETFCERIGLADTKNLYQTTRVSAATILILLGKHLIMPSVQPWFRSRCRSLAAIFGYTIPTELLKEPKLENVQLIYRVISSHPTLRAATVRLFQGCMQLSGQTGEIFKIIINLLSWSEMTHISMIQAYIYEQYPEVLSMRILQGSEFNQMASAWELLGKLPLEDRPLARLLYPGSQTKPLHRENFYLLIDAAYAIAQKIKPSFKNYVIGKDTSSLRITETIGRYIETRSILGYKELTVSGLRCADTEVKDYHQQYENGLSTWANEEEPSPRV